MGHCRYCGHRAGWLRSSHRRCAATYRQGLAQLVDLVAAASGRPDFTQRRMLRILDGLAQQCYVPAQYLIGFGERLSAGTSEARHDPGGEILQVSENLPLRYAPVGKLNQQALQAAHLPQLLNLFRHMVRRTNQQGA